MHLIDNPAARSLLVLGYEDKYRAADDVMRVLEHKPTGLEGVDHRLVEDMKVVGVHDEELTMLPEGRGWLLVEFGGETKRGGRRPRARVHGRARSTATARRPA